MNMEFIKIDGWDNPRPYRQDFATLREYKTAWSRYVRKCKRQGISPRLLSKEEHGARIKEAWARSKYHTKNKPLRPRPRRSHFANAKDYKREYENWRTQMRALGYDVNKLNKEFYATDEGREDRVFVMEASKKRLVNKPLRPCPIREDFDDSHKWNDAWKAYRRSCEAHGVVPDERPPFHPPILKPKPKPKPIRKPPIWEKPLPPQPQFEDFDSYHAYRLARKRWTHHRRTIDRVRGVKKTEEQVRIERSNEIKKAKARANQISAPKPTQPVREAIMPPPTPTPPSPIPQANQAPRMLEGQEMLSADDLYNRRMAERARAQGLSGEPIPKWERY